MPPALDLSLISQLIPPLVVMLGVVLARVALRRVKPWAKGLSGELRVSHLALAKLDTRLYTSFRDVYLPRPDGKGFTQIDHVVVSPYGIFVIETKNYGGWIFGSEDDAEWTQCHMGGLKHRFQNPLFQNRLHLNALKLALNHSSSAFHSIVYFAGGSTFKTRMPPNVLDRGLNNFIQAHTTPLLSAEHVSGVTDQLNRTVSAEAQRKAKKAHLRGSDPLSKHPVALWQLVLMCGFMILPWQGLDRAFSDTHYPIVFVGVLSLVAFWMCAGDKRKAKRGEWRTSEATLHFLELLGGWPGSFIAQRRFRHKISKAKYQATFWLIVISHQLIAADYLNDWKFSSEAIAHLTKEAGYRHNLREANQEFSRRPVSRGLYF